MPRGPRLDAPGVLQHVMARGLERRPLFRDGRDRADFLQRVATLAQAGAWTVYAWALLPNHVHLLVRTGTTPLATALWEGTWGAPGQVGAAQWVTCAPTRAREVPPAMGRATPSLGPSLASGRVTARAKRRQESCRPKSAPYAGMNGTSPEIPYTVDADPYPTAGKAPAAARQGESGPASTGASAVSMQGWAAHGTREIPSSARPADRGRRREAIPSTGVGVVGSRIGLQYRGSGVMPVEGRGRRTSVSSGHAWRALRGPLPCPCARDDSTHWVSWFEEPGAGNPHAGFRGGAPG
jgi:hypothetical protein